MNVSTDFLLPFLPNYIHEVTGRIRSQIFLLSPIDLVRMADVTEEGLGQGKLKPHWDKPSVSRK